MIHRLLPIALSFFVLTVSAPSRAETCGNVTERGVCQDAKTLIYCKSGQLETVRCATGELCANDERFSGAAGCIATRYTGCGAVTELGLCAGNTLLFCANNTVDEIACPDGTTCGAQMTDEGLEYDCLGTAVLPTVPTDEPDPVEPGHDGTSIDEPSPMETASEAPGPSVEQGGAPVEEFTAGGSGCSGAAGGLGLWGLLAGLGLWTGRRKA